jgi:hypothetical protein
MKKIILATTLVATIILGAFSVSAAEVEVEGAKTFVSSMDAETFLSTRIAQLDLALENDLIDIDQYNELLTHIEVVAAEGTFGRGPENGLKGEGNAECILGEDSNLGIFRSESAGMRTGQGNGVGMQSRDGSGLGSGGNGQRRGGGRNR